MTDLPQLQMRRPRLDDVPLLPLLPEAWAIRDAVAGDAMAISRVLSSAFEVSWSIERVQQKLLDAPDVVATLLVTIHDLPVATASARLLPDTFPGSGYVHWVGVDPAHRGHQLGRIVTLAVLHRFRAIGCRDAVLETDPPRLAAIRTYLGLGFEPVPVVPDHETIWRGILADPRMSRGLTLAKRSICASDAGRV